MNKSDWCYGSSFHKFEPRYTEEKEVTNSSNDPEARIIKKYVYDICVNCGKIVKDNEDESISKDYSRRS